MNETNQDRCEAVHVDDPSPCEGGTVVRVVDQSGGKTTGCVHHAARLYASLIRPRVYPLPGCDGQAIEVYNRAQTTLPFQWQTERQITDRRRD